MKNRIITIGRQFGSGGRTIGKEVAAKLGIPCYDSELIERASEESGLSKEYVAERGEYTAHDGWFSSVFAAGHSYHGMSNQDYLWAVQKKIILDLAEQGPCVIVGRCADYILRDVADCLKVFVRADMDKRAERIVNLYGEASDAPLKRLKEKDKRRAAYYKFYTETEWGDINNYHIVLDSGVIGIEKCVDIIADLYRNIPADENSGQ